MTAADEQIRTRCDKQDEAAKTEPEKKQLRQSCNDESLKAVQAFLIQYEDRYKAEVLILREEILYRFGRDWALPELRHKDSAADSSKSSDQCFRSGRSRVESGGARKIATQCAVKNLERIRSE